MSDDATVCPTEDTLNRFVGGLLSDRESEQIEDHLMSCQTCGALLGDADPPEEFLVNLLRARRPRSIEQDAHAPGPARHASELETLLQPPAGGLGPGAKRLGRYQVGDELGRGGMGVVYRAFDLALRRHVALKFIPQDHVPQTQLRERFRREAEAAARLQHANIVQVFECELQQDPCYIAFELVEGGSLTARIRHEAMPPREAAGLVATLAEAVGYAHHRDVIHRDLKPANVLLTPDGTPKIADFGLAKMLDADLSHTVDGELMGSPAYMAPEQARGDIAAIGPATDIYALGAILYEAATGRPPFREGTLLATLEAIKLQAPVPPRTRRPEIDKDYEQICLKCLAKSPAERYATATELAVDLRRYTGGMPVSARRSTLTEQLGKLARRHPFAAAISGLLAAMLLAFVVVVALYNQRLASANRQVAHRSEVVQRNSYALQLQRAADVAASNPPQALRLLQNEQYCPAPLRDFCWSYLVHACDRAQEPWANGSRVVALAVAPGGRQAASGDASGVVRIWAAGESTPTQEFQAHDQQINDLAYAPDGATLVSASDDGNAKLWSLTPPQPDPVQTFTADAGRVNGLALSPDNTRLVTAHSDGRLRVWTVATPRVEKVVDGHTGSVFRVAFSKDGALLASVSRDQTLRIWDPQDWTQQAQVVAHEGPVHAVRFRPGASYALATAGADRVIRNWTYTAGKGLTPAGASDRLAATISSIDYSADGGQLAAATLGGRVRLFAADAAKRPTTIQEQDAQITSVVFQGATHVIAAADDGRIRRWDLAPKNTPIAIAAHTRSVTGVAWAAGGAVLASASVDGRVRTWLPHTGENAGEWRQEGAWVTSVGATPDHAVLYWEADGVALAAAVTEDGALVAKQLPASLTHPLAIAYTGDKLLEASLAGLACLDSRTGQELWSGSPGEVRLFNAARDGSCFAVVNGRGDLSVGRYDTGGITPVAGVRSDAACMAISAQGHRVAIGALDGGVSIIDPLQPQTPVRAQGHSGPILCLTFSPDGRTVATSGEDRTLRFWDPVTGAERLSLEAPQVVSSLAFAPDGKAIAAGSTSGGVWIWGLQEPD